MSTPAQLEVDAVPEGVSRARRWLRERLAGWSDDGLDSAELVLSELVTNVVLHGRGPVQLAARRDLDRVVMEVLDRSPAPPVINHYTSGASTGRGLLVVDGLADGWGVRSFPNGKGVWAVLRDLPMTSADLARVGDGTERGQEPPDWPPPSDLERAAPIQQLSDLELVPVRILGLPVAVYLSAREHNDALLREFRYLLPEHDPRRGASEVPARLVTLAEEVRTRFAREGGAMRSQVEAAVAAGRLTVDLELSVPRQGWEALTRLTALLVEADRYCERGELLTLATSDELRRFRTWYAAQIAAQMSGEPPTPWPYGLSNAEEEREQ
ncbi:MAG: putative sensor protein [Acidimicrobiaceae bacterium]|nr:putative sensor protein [Acidimicrobiaceae bacterium]